MTTHLEDLPQELFLTLFNFMSAEELYRSFYHLNLRLDDLLRFFVSSKLRLDPETSKTIHDPVIASAFAHIILPHRISLKNGLMRFVPKEISERRIIGSFQYSLSSRINCDIHSLLQLCPQLKCLAMNYYQPRSSNNMQLTDINCTLTQCFPLQHLEIGECSFDTLYSILIYCPKLLHLKFQMTDYPGIPQYKRLASDLTTFVPMLQNLHCSYQLMSNSQDSCDYRLSDKENVLNQIRQMHPLFQNVTCYDDYVFCPHEGGTSCDYLALILIINGGDRTVFFY